MKYTITFPVFATVTVTVDAENIDAAHELACDEADVNLCSSCGRRVCTEGGIDDEGAVAEVNGETFTLKAGQWVKEE